MLKIRRPLGRLIFNMGIAIPGKTVFLIETAPWSQLAIHDPNICLARTGDKPLPEPMMIQFTDARMRQQFLECQTTQIPNLPRYQPFMLLW